MSATILLAAFAWGQAAPDKLVTDSEKKEFLKVLATLPTEGEFFTEEAGKKAVPYTRVLLALTEKDLANKDIYAFLALSSGLLSHKEARQYGVSNFSKIAHPTIKLAWAIGLFEDKPPSPEIVAFLRKAVDTRIAQMLLGPGFEDFKERVVQAHEGGRLMKVELVKQHSIKAFEEFDEDDCNNKTLVFAPGPLVHGVRPLKHRGELITYDLAKSTTSRLTVPQPKDFKAEFDFASYFDSPALSINAKGDVLCRWTIRGNGDHGLALLKKGSDTFVVNRVDLPLQYSSHVVAGPDGVYYLIHWRGGSAFTVFQADQDLKLIRLGDIKRRQSWGIFDGLFISNDVLHLLCTGEEPHQAGLRSLDFDLRQKRLLHNREILRLDKHNVWKGETVLQLSDGSLHYMWGTWDRGNDAEKNAAARTALYYQSEADTTTVKVADGCHYRAVTLGDRIIVCYTLEKAPDKVFFCVIRHGTVGSVSEITAAKGREHNLWSEDMAFYSEGERIWFMNTLRPNTIYEMKLVDATSS
jgi:hypothetical protein